MKLNSVWTRNSILFLLFLFGLSGLSATVSAQEQKKSDKAKVAATETKKTQNLKPVPHGEDLESKQEGPEFLRRRQDYFFKPRAFPLGFIPQGARERALEERKQMYIREGRLGSFVVRPEVGFLAPALLTTSPWTAIGPQPTSSSSNPPFTSGRVTALAVNPNNPNNAYLGGADGGLWVTTNGGTAWTPLTDNPPNAANIPTVAVGAIALDPTTCGSGSTGICTTVYVGTGEDNFAGDNIYGEGVLNCTITAGTPPTAVCTQDGTFRSPSPLDQSRGGPMIGAIAVDRLTGSNNILLAGVRGRGTAIESGVWCSSNKGATWTEVLPTSLTNGAGDPGTDVAFASDGTAWVALGFPIAITMNNVPVPVNGIYKSNAPVTSCSITFTKQTLPTAFTATNVGKITLALAPSDNTKIYAAIGDATTASATLLGVVRSTNATSATPTWTQLSDPLVSAATGFCIAQCLYDMALSVDPKNPDVVYAGGSGQNPIIRTLNGTTTATWADVTAGTVVGSATPHVDTHAFAFAGDGSAVFVGNDGGVWGSNTPGGALSWVNVNGPSTSSTGALSITQFYPGVSIHPANPSFAMGGTQDNEVQLDLAFLGSSSGLLWQSVGPIQCDGGYTAIDLTIPSTSYGECEYIPGNPIFPVIAVTFNGDGILGNGFLANVGIDNTDRGAFIPPLVMDPSNTLTLYFGTCRVWQTKDGANTWTAISPDVTTSSHPATCPVPTTTGQLTASLSTVVVAPSNANTVYVGSDEGEIEVTSNASAGAGATWTSIVTTTLPARSVTQIAVDPSNPAIAYAAFSGFGSCATFCDGKGHLFKTINGTAGAATVWTDIDGTTTKLPDIPVNAIVIDPNDATHNTLFVGTDIGAFSTTDGGVNWSPLGAANSMPNAQILALTLHNPSRTLRAATHGRGVWDLSLGGAPALSIGSLSPFSSSAAPSTVPTLTVTGTGFNTGTSIVQWNGSPRSTTFVSSTQLTATITAADLAAGGVVQVGVKDGANTTNTLPFTVLNPIPTVVSILPTTVNAGTNGLTLTVNGTGNSYVSGTNGTAVLFNGFTRPTTFVNSNQLTATLSASDLAASATVPIDTFTPQPGGGPDLNAAPPTLTINNANPTLASISPTTKVAGSGAFTLTVNGTGFSANSVVNFNGNAKITTFVSSMQLTAAILATDITTAGSDPVTVTNPAPGGGTTTAQTFTVTSSTSLTVSGGPATVTTAQAASGSATGTSTITVGGATAATTITCGSIPGVTCNALSIPQGTTSGMLTINVVDPSNTMTALAMPASQNLWAAANPPSSPTNRAGWWTLSGGTGLAAILLLFLPGRKRYRAALGFGLVCVMSFALGCGGYGGGGGGGGPVATTTKITVSTTKLAANASITVSATVTGGTPAGTVQFFVDGAALGSAAPLTSGSTGNITVTAAQAPAFLQLVGTHTVSAHYLGDAYTMASQSGTLNITVTGTTQLQITGASGGANANANVSLTIN